MKYKIEGYFEEKSNYPIVECLVRDEKRNAQENIYFAIDMLSSNTIISAKDLKSMNMSLDHLEEYNAGNNETAHKKYFLENPLLTFKSVIGKDLKFRAEKIPVVAGDDRFNKSNQYSVLGRNVLYNFALLINKQEDDISMMYDDDPSYKLLYK